jgi:hypothetical protein
LFADTAQVVDRFGLHLRIFLPKTVLLDMNDEELTNADLRTTGNILYFFFPGAWVLVQPDHAMVSFLSPLGLGETLMEEIALIPALPDAEEASKYWDHNVDLFRNTLDEDYVLAEKIQRGLGSGANSSLVFGRFEQALGWFHEQLEDLLRDNSMEHPSLRPTEMDGEAR